MRSKLHWEIPSSVDLEGFLMKYPPNFKYQIDHFYYIVDYLARGMDFDDLDDNGGFINLNAQKLQKVNHNYKAYIDHLLNNRFIRTDKKYIKGEKSTGYRLNRHSRYSTTVKDIPINDLIVYRHKLRDHKEQNDKLIKTQKNYPHLTKWFENLQIDYEGAINEVEKLYPEPTGAIRGTRKGKASSWEIRYRAIQGLDKIANKKFYYNVDENVGRYHSNLTNLKKELRNHITYNGQKLVNVDIKNSQPLFSTLLFNEEFYNEKSQNINIFHFPSILPLISPDKHSFISYTIMLVKTLYKADIQDIKLYLELVNSGQFYEEISKILYPLADFDKKKIKLMTFIVFFSNNRYISQKGAQMKRDFKTHFPETYGIFKLIKRKNHTALARLLQRIESFVMIENVVARIAVERPELPIFTIHDSVVTTFGNEEYVATIIIDEVFRLTGLNARLGIEFWNSDEIID